VEGESFREVGSQTEANKDHYSHTAAS